MSTKDMENVLRSMTIECIDLTEENIQDYIEDYNTHRISIKISKNTQRILNNHKQGRETYEDVILKLATPREVLKVGHVDFKVETYEDGELVQHGFVDLSTITEPEPVIMFYDDEGKPTNLPRMNPHPQGSDKYKTWDSTFKAWIADENFIKHIWECKDEDTEFIGHDYILVINEGCE